MQIFYPTVTHKHHLSQSILKENLGNTVRIRVGGGSSILEVTETLGGSLSGNSDGRSTVGNTGELISIWLIVKW